MESVVREIEKLRRGRNGVINTKNSNRYRVVYTENDGSETAYYFAVPIYNSKTKKIVSLKFNTTGDVSEHIGSSSNITISKRAILKNNSGACYIDFPSKLLVRSERFITYQFCTVYPTLNGIAIRVKEGEQLAKKIVIETDIPNLDAKCNSKCFSIMMSKFTPFITFSCIGVIDGSGSIVSEAYITYKKTGANRYELYLSSSKSGDILIEVNLYEPKLFQDTTVESKNPQMNNAYGTTAFIGNSSGAGEMWLYSRPTQTIFHELYDKFIHSATFYVPILNESDITLIAHKLTQRFCSFGSTWEKKKTGTGESSASSILSGYYKISVFDMFTANRILLPQIQGFILKSQNRDDGFAVVPTGDSHLNPQILEMNYRR